jgi:hypothetical protein
MAKKVFRNGTEESLSFSQTLGIASTRSFQNSAVLGIEERDLDLNSLLPPVGNFVVIDLGFDWILK